MEENSLNLKDKIKFANYNLLYILFYNYYPLKIEKIFFQLIEIFQVLSLIINGLFKENWKGGKFYTKTGEFLQYFRLLHYSDNNQDFYLLLLYFSNGIIFITFMLYFYLFILSFNEKDLKKLKITIRIFRFLCYLLSGVLLAPLIEILYTFIVCDSEMYFSKKFKCWESNHIIISIISFVMSILLFFLSFIYINFNFNFNENILHSIAKQLIMNSEIVFMFARGITVILLEFLTIKNILMFVVVIIFIFSILNFYCIQNEFKFVLEINFSNLCIYCMNIIYLWGCTCLLIAKIITNVNFDGMFLIFILGIVLIIVYQLTVSKKNLLNLKINFLKNDDKETFRIIYIILNDLEKRNKKRENLVNIYGYFTEKNQMLKNSDDNKIYKSIIKSNFKSNSNTNNNSSTNENISKRLINISESELETLILNHIDNLFHQALNYYKTSLLLTITYAIFQFKKLEQYYKSYMTFEKSLKIDSLSFSQEFFIYRIKRKIEERIFEEGKDSTNISLKFQSNLIIKMISDVSIIYNEFWNELLLNKENEDIQKLDDFGSEINSLMKKIEEKFEMLLKNNFYNKKIIFLYGIYVRDILNDEKKAKKFLENEDEEKEEKNDSRILDLNNLISSNDFQFIVISGEKSNQWNIIKISMGICALLGYSEKDLLNKNYEILLPDILRKEHEKMLTKNLQKFKNKEIFNENNKQLKSINAIFKTSNKCIISLNLDVGLAYDEEYNSIFFSKINFDISKQFFFDIEYVILTNENFIIEHFSSNSISELELNSMSEKNLNNDITIFIKEINEDCANKVITYQNKYQNFANNESKISNSNNHQFQIDNNLLKLKLKKKLLKEKFNKENVITWKNQKKYKLQTNEIKINSKIIAYVFKFEKFSNFSNTNYISNSNSIINSVNSLIPNEKRKSLLKSINNSNLIPNSNENNFENVFNINQNFVPKNENKINFDAKEKIFYLKFDSDKIIESAKDVFNERFSQNTKNSSNENNSTKKNESSNNENENEFSEESSESEEEEEEKKEENITNNKNEENLNKIEDFYKVKLNNIKFMIFDFEKNLTKEIFDFDKQSKMEQIIKIETEKTSNVKLKNISNKNSPNTENKKETPNANTKNKSIVELNIESIKKISTPHLINKSIIIYIVLMVILLGFFLFISFIYFNRVYSERSNMYTINIFILYQTQLFRNILHSFFFSCEMTLLKNPKYYNFYQNESRDEYYKECQRNLLEIYNDSIKQLESFSFNSVSLSEETKKILDDFTIPLYSFFWDEKLNLTTTTTNMKLTDTLSEFDYCLFSFANADYDDVHPLNSDYIFMIFNIDNNLNGLNNNIKIYFKEMNKQLNDVKNKIWTYFFIFLICILFVLIVSVQSNSFLISQKENLLRVFYKIKDDDILVVINKTKKFLNLNAQRNENVIAEPKIVFDDDVEENDENKSLLHFKEINKNYSDNINNNNNDKRKNQLNLPSNHQKKCKIFYHKDIIKNFIITLIFYIILIIILLITTFYITSILTRIYHYDIIYYVTILIEKNFMNLYNYIRLDLLYQPMIVQSKFLQVIFDDKMNLTGESYPYNSEYIEWLTRNISNTVLTSELEEIYSKLEQKSFCDFFDESMNKYNITCDKFAHNVTNFGLSTIISYYIDSIYLLIPLFVYATKNASVSNFTYNELIYGTEEYEQLIPKDENERKEYEKLNPFNLFNNDICKDLQIQLVFVLGNAFSNITNEFDDSIEKSFKNIKFNIKLLSIVFYVVISIYFFLYLIQYIFKKNNDINKVRIMLNIIPLNILFDVISNKKKKN